MPGYASNPGTAGGDMFADASPSQPETKSEGEEPKEGEREGVTAMLPKAILAGKTFKPGDEVVLKIVKMLEDQVEVAYATGEEKGGEKEEYGGGEEKESGNPGSMASMMY